MQRFVTLAAPPPGSSSVLSRSGDAGENACVPGEQVMKRYHQELKRIIRAQRIYLRRSGHLPDQPVSEERKFQRGRFRKRKPMDCGKTRCLLCHFEKLLHIPSNNDRIQQMRFAESLQDYERS